MKCYVSFESYREDRVMTFESMEALMQFITALRCGVMMRSVASVCSAEGSNPRERFEGCALWIDVRDISVVDEGD